MTTFDLMLHPGTRVAAPRLAWLAALTAAVAAVGGAAVGFWVLFGATLTLDFAAITCF